MAPMQSSIHIQGRMQIFLKGRQHSLQKRGWRSSFGSLPKPITWPKRGSCPLLEPPPPRSAPDRRPSRHLYRIAYLLKIPAEHLLVFSQFPASLQGYFVNTGLSSILQWTINYKGKFLPLTLHWSTHICVCSKRSCKRSIYRSICTGKLTLPWPSPYRWTL